MSGLEVIRGVRAWADIPIIVLSARDAERDKVEALDFGANDYVTKPFGIEELMARLRAAERVRASQRPHGPTVTDHFTIDYDSHRVMSAGGAPIHLTPIEFALLAHLAQRPGHLVKHSDLLRAVWGPEYASETNYLRVHITHLRKKIEPDPSKPIYVLTEPGVGYRFNAP
jgi:two-component system KDP operon response regulator KdpE